MRDVAPGDLVAGKFRVDRVVGSGGMGVVAAATNVRLDQKVALKLLKEEPPPEVVERFMREARAAVKLKSEHVARVFDVGIDTEHGPYIVMELLEGSTLADLLRDKGRLSARRAAEYLIDACEGLSEAHAQGVVHQDIKPGNLFVAIGSDGNPCVKIVDFGIAKVVRHGKAEDAMLGARGVMYGTPSYLAPEQLRNDAAVDARADVWALGCVLFESVTAVKAFRAGHLPELVAKIHEGRRAGVPDGIDLPLGLAEIIDRCLANDPSRRFASTADLAVALLPFARRRAHSSALRAVERARASGLSPNVAMPASIPPPASSEREDSTPSLPTRAPAPDTPSIPARVVIRTSDAMTPMPAPRKSRALPLAIALGIVAIGVAGIVRLAVSPPSGPSTIPASRDTPSATKAQDSAQDPIPPEPPPSSTSAVASSVSSSVSAPKAQAAPARSAHPTAAPSVSAAPDMGIAKQR